MNMERSLPEAWSQGLPLPQDMATAAPGLPAEDTTAVEPAGGWATEGSNLVLQDPEGFVWHQRTVEQQCKWSPPELLSRYVRGHVQAHRSRIPPVQFLDQMCFKGKGSNGCAWTAELRICRVFGKDEIGDFEHVVTRVGPMAVGPGQYRSVIFPQPRPTRGASSGTPYFTETYDGIVDATGYPISYPPIHPHHSASYIVGPVPREFADFPGARCLTAPLSSSRVEQLKG